VITELRVRQTLAVMRQELWRALRGWSSVWLLFLAFAPTVIIVAHALHDRGCDLQEETTVLGVIIQVFYMRFGLFFGCLALFTRLIRGETSERTLHYLFLAPIRREVLVVGKLLAGTLTALVFFGAGVFASFILMYAHFPAGREFLLHGAGLSHLLSYLLVVVLACVGYGAVFLAMSLVFKNPILPAVFLLLWEGVNGALPVLLKYFSVTFYLKPLFPVELPVEGISGLFTVVAEPTPAWLATLGLIAFALCVLVFACWRIRRLEISYGTE
jgi:ABC-type transport system involved in multi-copper enzyme maturation permease subunit